MRASRLTESLLPWEEIDDDRALLDVEGGAHPEMDEEVDSLEDESNALLVVLKL